MMNFIAEREDAVRLCKPPVQLWVSVPLALLGFWLLSGTIAPLPNSHPVASRTLKPSAKASPAHSAREPRLVNSFGKLPLSFEANLGQTDARVKFLSRGRGYTLFLTGDEAVLSLRIQDSGVRRQIGNSKLEIGNSKFEKPVLSAAKDRNSIAPRGLLKRPTEHGLRATDFINSPFRIHNSEFLSPESRIASPEPRSFVCLKLVGANPRAKVVGLDPLPGKSNYFIGNDPKKWRTNVPNYARVMLKDVYPGIDQVFYGREGELEYDFVVHPGADPTAIAWEIETGNSKLETGNSKIETGNSKFENGQSKILNPKSKIAPNGDLVISLGEAGAGEVRFHKPVVYQEQSTVDSRKLTGKTQPQRTKDNGPRTTDVVNPKSRIQNRQFLDGRYMLRSSNPKSKIENPKYEVAFEVGPYDRSKPLIIDPVLIYSTYLGGTDGDYPAGIAVDSSGNACVTGYTSSLDFPTQNPLQRNDAGGYDAFVTKLSAAGDAVVYSTYLGGSSSDQAFAIAVDSSGNAYLTGETLSPDFPILNAIQAVYGGNNDLFVTKLNATGSALVYSTYLGGTSDDLGLGIAVDPTGDAFIAGFTNSIDFPTMSAIQGANAGLYDAFVAKVNARGSALVYSTYLGGTSDDLGLGIAVDPSGNAGITGFTYSTDFPTVNPLEAAFGGGTNDVFVAKLNAGGSALVYSTFLGGTDFDVGTGIAIDSSGSSYVAGFTYSMDFPTQNPLQGSNAGSQDAFVAKLNAAGDALAYSTYLGGTFGEDSAGIAVDSSGSAYITGFTNSIDFPTQNPLQGSKAGGQDAFLAKLDPAGSALLQSTYLGGIGSDIGTGIAVDGSGYTYITGWTVSTDFPTLNPLQPALVNSNPDAFVTKLSLVPVPGMRLSPTHPDFGSQLVDATSTAQTVTITNVGELPLTVSSIAASGDFDVAAVSAPCSTGDGLDPGLSCGMSVTFTPTVSGTRTGTLTIVSNAPASPYNARLSGTGTDFAVVAQSGETTSATVNAGGTATFNLQLAPTGLSGTVALACAFQGLTPQGASCSVSPAAVALNGNDPAPFAVNVTTTARAMAGPEVGAPRVPLLEIGGSRPGRDRRRPPLQPGAGRHEGLPLQVWLMALMLSLGLVAAWRRRGQVRDLPLQWRRAGGTPALQLLPFGALLLFVLLWAACGGGVGGGNTGTPPGTYSLTVTATASGVSRSISLTLVVN